MMAKIYGVNKISLVPLDENGQPIGDPQEIPLSTFDFVDVTTDALPEDDFPLITGPQTYTMELKNVDVAALMPFFSPIPETDDSLIVEFQGHKIKGHLEYVGEEIINGKVKQRYDMLDGVFICGPHDLEGNHV